MVLSLIFFACFIWFEARWFWKKKYWCRHTGTVVSLDKSSDSLDSPIVEIFVNGQSYQRSLSVSFIEPLVGQKWEVIYNPKDPNQFSTFSKSSRFVLSGLLGFLTVMSYLLTRS